MPIKFYKLEKRLIHPKPNSMKKFLTLFLSLAILANTFAAVNVEAPPRKASEIMVPIGAGQMVSLYDLSRMKVKKLETLTGKKMNLKEKMAFKLAQVKMKKELKRYEATGKYEPVDFKDPVDKWMWFWI